MSYNSSTEWFKKANINYVSAFINLWLAFNSLYKNLYLNNSNLRTDRDYINAIKLEQVNWEDFSNHLCLFNQFKRLWEEESNEWKEFRLYLGELILKFSWLGIGNDKIKKNEYLKPQMNWQVLNELSFKEIIHPKNFQLKRKPKGYKKLKEKCYVIDEPEKIWPYLIEVIYMIRNKLFHWELEPTEENLHIIRLCYNILFLIIKDIITNENCNL